MIRMVTARKKAVMAGTESLLAFLNIVPLKVSWIIAVKQALLAVSPDTLVRLEKSQPIIDFTGDNHAPHILSSSRYSRHRENC